MKRLCRQLKFLTFGDIKREGCTFVIEDVGISLGTSVFTSQLFGSFLTMHMAKIRSALYTVN